MRRAMYHKEFFDRAIIVVEVERMMFSQDDGVIFVTL
jgi:hypothetical protein